MHSVDAVQWVHLSERERLPLLRSSGNTSSFLTYLHKLGTVEKFLTLCLLDLSTFYAFFYRGLPTKDINNLRQEKFLERFSTKHRALPTSSDGVDMIFLPLCRDSLRIQTKRANYQALTWNQAGKANQNVPAPEIHDWELAVGKLEFKWTEGALMLQELVEVLIARFLIVFLQSQLGIDLYLSVATQYISTFFIWK